MNTLEENQFLCTSEIPQEYELHFQVFSIDVLSTFYISNVYVQHDLGRSNNLLQCLAASFGCSSKFILLRLLQKLH